MPSLKSSDKQQYRWRFEALGTAWSIETAEKLPTHLSESIAERIEQFDKTYSRFRNDSLAWQLRRPGEYEFPPDIVPLLNVYKKVYNLTDGRVTPLIGGMLEDAGYDAVYSLQPKELRDTAPFEVLGWDGDVKLQPAESVVLDVGAAGKGYLVDLLAEILEINAVTSYVIDASGDIKQRGRVESIGLEHPFDKSKVIGVAYVENKSLCASAVNRRAWRGMHHIFDPRTKKPTDSIVASWVVADSALMADTLATALFFVPARKLFKDFSFTYVTIDKNGFVDAAPDFRGELFT